MIGLIIIMMIIIVRYYPSINLGKKKKKGKSKRDLKRKYYMFQIKETQLIKIVDKIVDKIL